MSFFQGEHKGYVSHIEDVSKMYVQLTSRSDALNSIEELLAELGPSAEPEVYCPLGQACMTIYSQDGRYYRYVSPRNLFTCRNIFIIS